MDDLNERGANTENLTEPAIDTTTPMSPELFGIVTAFAQLRGDSIRHYSMFSLAYARAQGRVGCRPTVTTPECTQVAVKICAAGKDDSAHRRGPRASA